VTDPVIIAEWEINSRGERARVTIEKFNRAWLINIRKWYAAGDGEMRPGRQGIALAIKHLPQLTEAMNAALAAANERELISEPGAAPAVASKTRP
jgi:hypothetical protein